MKEEVDVRDFGAKCDTVNNDAPAIRAAVAHALEIGATTVLLRSHRVSEAIDIQDLDVRGES